MSFIERDIRKSVVYPHPRERVFAALTDSSALAAWLMPNDFEPRMGHEFVFRTKPQPGFDGIVHCRVIELDPPARIAYSWRGGSLDTVVRFELDAIDATHTRVSFEHTGFDGLRGVVISAALGRGWTKMLDGRLPDVIDKLSRGVPLVPRADLESRAHVKPPAG